MHSVNIGLNTDFIAQARGAVAVEAGSDEFLDRFDFHAST